MDSAKAPERRSMMQAVGRVWTSVTKTRETDVTSLRGQNARLLASLLVVLTIGFALLDCHKAATVPGYVVPWLGYAFLIGAFFVNRFLSYHAAALMVCIMFPTVLFLQVLLVGSPETIHALVFAVVGTILSVILLPPRQAYALAAVTLIGMLWLGFFAPLPLALRADIVTPLFVCLFGTALAHLLRVQQNTIERSRRYQLERSERRYRLFLDNLSGVAYEIDFSGGRATMFQGAVKKICGYSAQEMIDGKMSMSDLFHPDDAVRIREEMVKLNTIPGYVSDAEYRIVQPDGAVRWVRTISQCVEIPLENRRVLQGLMFDSTEARYLNERLRQSEKMEAIGQLAGGIAHDFNNQLAGIVGYADLLRVELDPNTELEEYANGILLAARRAADLTNQLLAFARKGRYQAAEVDLHTVIFEVARLLQHTLNRNIVIKQQLNAQHPVTIGDPTQLQNALLNLAVNARDAMPDGGELIFATDICELDEKYCARSPFGIEPGYYIQVCVTDNGQGMDAETRKHIFEPFFTTKEPGKGTGMGLAAVYGTVKSHKGAVNVYSEIGHGTTFKIYVPLAPAEASGAAVRETSSAHDGTPSLRILLVDDEPVVLDMAASMLQNMGHTVIAAANGSEAIDAYRARKGEIDLVILDMIMPVKGGRDTFREIRQLDEHAKVLLTSGYSLNGEAQGLLEEGVSGFVQKPYRTAQLAQSIAAVFGVRKTP